jgi:glycosyltransferase involved in cell wall biosynthesis
MATFLINASNIKQGGGVQVTQSICSHLSKFEEHHFVVVLSNGIDATDKSLGENVEVFRYDIKHSLKTVLLGCDSYLDSLTLEKHIDAVLTVFGPSLWVPRVPHLCGFARAQLLLRVDGYSPSIKDRIMYNAWKWLFKKSSDTFYTENAFISKQLPTIFGKVKVYTVTNYYNQVFDQSEKWNRSINLPEFDGVTCLSVSSHYPHKNFEIMIGVSQYLQKQYPEFNFRFVLTFKENEMPVPDEVKEHFLFVGKVDVAECPYLYGQSDIMFMPTLMECFTATYPEAMRMKVPIVTTDLEFARGLCGDGACYYNALDAKAAAEAIYKVATDKEYARKLVESGGKKLLTYDNYEQRAKKLIRILEDISQKRLYA